MTLRSFDAIQRSLTIERTTLIARPVPHYAHEQAEVVQMRWRSIRSAALIMVTCAPVVSILIFAIVGGR